MPTCPHPLHAGSGLPVLLPPDAFHTTPTGQLRWCCRHCARVARHLNKYVGRQPWGLTDQRQAWTRYWTLRARQARRAQAPRGHRWCSRGHYARRHDFTAKTRGWCRPCQAIGALQRYYRRQGQALTWPEASARHFRSPQTRSRAKNAHAPVGQRWCRLCGTYFVVPGTWTRRYRRARCPAHQAVYQAQWRARRRAAAAD